MLLKNNIQKMLPADAMFVQAMQYTSQRHCVCKLCGRYVEHLGAAISASPAEQHSEQFPMEARRALKIFQRMSDRHCCAKMVPVMNDYACISNLIIICNTD